MFRLPGVTYMAKKNNNLFAIPKFSFSRRREGKEKEEENGRGRDERDNNRARATTCVAMSLNDWRLLENRSTSIHLEARLSCTYYTTSRAIYMWTYSRYIYASCTNWILHNRRDAAVHEVKTIPWKIGFTVPRFKQRVPRFCATKPRLAVTLRYCNTCRALFHSISHIYRCIQFFSRSKRFCKETILDLQNSSFLLKYW